MPKERIYFLDYLRALACFMVMLVHASECYYSDGVGISIANAATGVWVSIYDGISRCAVPLFVMISAFLLVPVAGSVATFFRKRLVRVVVPFALWSVLYATLPFLWGEINAQEVGSRLLHLVYNFNFASGHLWFVYMLIGLYLLMPIISAWLEKCSVRQERWFIGVWFLSTFFGYLNFWIGEVYGQCFWNEFHLLYYFSGFIGYLVVAHYIRYRLKWSTSKRLMIGGAMYIIGATIACAGFNIMIPSAADFYEIEIAWRFCSPNVAFESVGLFLFVEALCSGMKKENNLVKQISVNSYGMYLMHMFVLGFVYLAVKDYLNGSAAIPVIALATYILSFVITRVLSYLPGSRFIVG